MIKNIVLVISVVLVLFGILGFVPVLAPDHQLFGIFGVTTLYNILYIIVGLAGLYAVYRGSLPVIRLFGQICGVLFALATILGFLGMLDSLFNANLADNVLNLVLAAALLYVGFAGEDLPNPVSAPPTPIKSGPTPAQPGPTPPNPTI